MNYIVGIDEVGRGCLAGPVTVVAALIPSGLRLRNLPAPLRDSKKLSARQREILFGVFKKHPQIQYAIASVGRKAIDRINISQAANLAATRACARLIANREAQVVNGKSQIAKRIAVYLDGGLYLLPAISDKRLAIRTLVRADERITAVKIASIIAKVHRDRKMKRLAKKYPQYGLEIHKGYGTKIHVAAIKKFGPSEIHRRAFIRNIKFRRGAIDRLTFL